MMTSYPLSLFFGAGGLTFVQFYDLRLPKCHQNTGYSWTHPSDGLFWKSHGVLYNQLYVLDRVKAVREAMWVNRIIIQYDCMHNFKWDWTRKWYTDLMMSTVWSNRRLVIIAMLSGDMVDLLHKPIRGKMMKIETSPVAHKGADVKLSAFPVFWGWTSIRHPLFYGLTLALLRPLKYRLCLGSALQQLGFNNRKNSILKICTL